jgi:DNA-directed RNA polymerase subunit H (RpoH/RPB5)
VDIHSAKVRVIYNLNIKYKGPDINKLKKPPVLIDDDVEDGNDNNKWQFIIVTRDLPIQGKPMASDNTEIFKIEELLINVSRHALVPKHIPIRNPDEIKKILQEYKSTPQQFPQILRTDMQARYLALKPGELVRILRPSPSAGTYEIYRSCV